MASLTLVKLLFCGQGMTKLVEIYDEGKEKPAADYLALIDCGGRLEQSADAINAIVEKVAARDGTPKRIDLVVLSHQDGDHVSLLPHLGEALKKRLGSKVEVGDVYCGGNGWIPSNTKAVNDFLRCVNYPDMKARHFEPERSDYENATKRSDLGCIKQHKDVYFRILISNLAVAGATGTTRNASSSVVVVENGHEAVLLPGDATYQTMDRINGTPNLSSLLPSVLCLEIPHHGALASAVEDYDSSEDPSKYDWAVIDDFAKKMHAKYIGVSAGPWNSHCHPVDLVVDTFVKQSTEILPEHSYVTYLFHTQHWNTWTGELPIQCTVRTIEPVLWAWSRKKEKGKRRKLQDTGATYTSGEVVFKLAAPGVLKPQEKVEFRPRGTMVIHGTDEVIVQAPEP
ncbi:MBL fold metallo-hydrolase [Streptomyces sp. NPDC001549]|uniref:MBL fold metallo-hydrolase n=1 Tax=Streptomyces sp. NPDC001549 TaxID=3364586 RepID=UPI0036AA8524